MYPDLASAQPCVSCHNEHKDSPKTDWVLNDVMGATTWTYPKKVIGAAEYLDATDTLYASVSEAYQSYLDKTKQFEKPVAITGDWPNENKLVLPDADTFMTLVKEQSAARVLQDLVLNANDAFPYSNTDDQTNTTTNPEKTQ